jgi:DNA-binding transcriptional ArsR family regulator
MARTGSGSLIVRIASRANRTSQHLRSLKQSGLIRARRRGRNTHYRAQAEGLAPLVDWLSVYGLFWRDRFDRLKKLLKEIDR